VVAAGFSGITRTHYTLIFEMSDQQSLLTLPVNGEGVYGATHFWMLVTGKPAALRLADLLLRSLWYDVGRSAPQTSPTQEGTQRWKRISS